VEDQLCTAQQAQALVGQAPRPARQMRIRDDGDPGQS
jgi:hypothetical protein